MNVPVVFGIETEYGITREGAIDMDPVIESMALVRAYLAGPFKPSWDYHGEDPHEDQRGFRVPELLQDYEEHELAKTDVYRPFSYTEMKSDLALPNGARFYNDHTHPEYSTPECRSLSDLIAHDRAGERIVFRAARKRNREITDTVQLYKNNTDFHGHSYGCHDNYLVARSIPFGDLVMGLLPFLVTRQIIAGAGKVGIETQEGSYEGGCFQLSQRADFIKTELSVDTMHNRPILNTRDEPHADRTKYRRLHLIVGDANMCEYATALKIGTTRLVLDLIERGAAPTIELVDPVEGIKTISRDPHLKAALPCKASGKMNGMMTGIDIQRVYCDVARTTLAGTDAETDWILREWSEVLGLLRHDRASLVGRVDWVTKQWLLETFIAAERLDWSDPWLMSLDLEYHNVDPDRGLFLALEAQGKTRRLCDDAMIERAIHKGPADTRGGIRGLCVARFREKITSVQWERICFEGGVFQNTLDMSDLFDPDRIETLRVRIEQAADSAAVQS